MEPGSRSRSGADGRPAGAQPGRARPRGSTFLGRLRRLVARTSATTAPRPRGRSGSSPRRWCSAWSSRSRSWSLMGIGLRAIIDKTMADAAATTARSRCMQDGDYRTAIRDFDASSPVTPRTAAPARRGSCARWRTSGSTSRSPAAPGPPRWRPPTRCSQAVGAEPEFRDERTELAELVIRIGEGLADRARRSADEKSLQEAEPAVPLHARIAGEPAPTFLKRSRLPEPARRGPGRGPQGPDSRGGARRDGPGARQRLGVRRLHGARRPRRAVRRPRPGSRADPADDPGQRPDPAGGQGRPHAEAAATTDASPTRSARPRAWSCGHRPTCPASPPAAESLVYGLADGFAYGLDATTGRPALAAVRRPGRRRSCPRRSRATRPSWSSTPATTSCSGSTPGAGRLVWRLDLGEPVESPPAGAGRPALPGAAQRQAAGDRAEDRRAPGRRWTWASRCRERPVSDEQGRFLYVVGRRDCLFVLARDPLVLPGRGVPRARGRLDPLPAGADRAGS